MSKIYQSVRRFSTSQLTPTVCWPGHRYGPRVVQKSELGNGIKVAATKTAGTPVAACTVMFQAGSRYETNDDLGVNHFIRVTSPGAGQAYTAFSKVRMLHQYGAHLTCTCTRQYIAFTLCCPQPAFKTLKYYLLDTAARACYNEWDIQDNKPFVRDDLTRITIEERAIDLVQKACWAGPLSNSLYCEEDRIEEMSQEKILSFVNNNFKSSLCTVASIGVPFEETLSIAEKISPRRDKPRDRPEYGWKARRGFEYHDLGAGSDTCIAAVVPGIGGTDLKCLLKYSLLAAALGTGSVQAGQHALDRTAQRPLGLVPGTDVHTHLRAFNISYCDTGVFGILCKTRSQTACKFACATVEFLSNIGEMDFSQLEAGKQRLKLELALHDEDSAALSEGLALQTAYNITLDSVPDAIALVDGITLDELSCVAKSLSSKRSEMAIAVVGDCGVVPHDRQLLNF